MRIPILFLLLLFCCSTVQCVNLVPSTKDAFVSLMSTIDFFQPICVLGRSLDKHHHLDSSLDEEGRLVISDGIDRVVLVDSRLLLDKQKHIADHLINCGWTKIVGYDHIDNPHLKSEQEGGEGYHLPSISYMSKHDQARIARSFNKIHAFNLPYDRVVYLDGDTLVRSDISNLFDCVGNPYEINSNLKPTHHFRFCAYQDDLHDLDPNYNGDYEKWDLDSGVMVLTPSSKLFDNMMEFMNEMDIEDSDFLGRYMFWTCGRGNPEIATEQQRLTPMLLLNDDSGKESVALPRLWMTGGWEGEELAASPLNSGDRLASRLKKHFSSNEYELWPMYECKRLEERYNMRVSRAAHDYVTSKYQDIRIVHFSSALWKPFFWQTSLFSGFFAEYRYYAGIGTPNFIILPFFVSLMVLTYIHPGMDAIKRLVLPLTSLDYMVSLLLGSIPGIVTPFFILTPLIPRTLDPQLAIWTLLILVNMVSAGLAFLVIRFHFGGENKRFTHITFYIFWCYVACTTVYPMAIMALSSTRFTPSHLLIASGILSYFTVVVIQVIFLHPYLRPFFPSARAVSPD